MLILGFDLNLIISRKTIHEGEYLTSCTLIQNIINEWCGKVIFWMFLIQVSKVSAYPDGSLLLIYQNGVGYPFSQGNHIDKPILE